MRCAKINQSWSYSSAEEIVHTGTQRATCDMEN